MSQVTRTEPISIEVPLDISTELIASVSEFYGKLRLDIRHYFHNKEGKLLPTKRGINIPLEQANILFETLQELLYPSG